MAIDRPPPEPAFDVLRRGPVAIYVPPTGAPLSADDKAAQIARCRTFITALGGDGDAAVVFDDGDAVLAHREDSFFFGEVLDFDATPAFDRLQRWDEPVYAAVVVDDPAPIYKRRHGSNDIDRIKERGTAFLPRFDVSILMPGPETVEALWEGSADAWQPLIDGLRRDQFLEAAPASFVDPLLRRSSNVAAWVQRLMEAIEEIGEAQAWSPTRIADEQDHLDRKLTRWLNAGIASRVPIDDPRRLQVTVDMLSQQAPAHDITEQTRALRDEVRRAMPDSPLLYRATVLHGARCLEEGRWDDALAAARDAERIAERIPEEERVGTDSAARLRAAAHLGRLEITEALAALEPVVLLFKILGGTAGLGVGSKRFFSGLDPLEDAKRTVAFHAQYTTGSDEEWLHALDSLAIAVARTHPALAEQLRAYVDRQRR